MPAANSPGLTLTREPCVICGIAPAANVAEVVAGAANPDMCPECSLDDWAVSEYLARVPDDDDDDDED